MKTEIDFDNFINIELPALAFNERNVFDQQFCSSAPIAIYGCGRLGRKLANALMQKGTPAMAFVDTNAELWGKEVEGIPVYSIADAAKNFGADAVIVVAVWSPGRERRYNYIKNKLQEAGCKNASHFLPLFWKYAEFLLPHYRLDLPSRLLTHSSQIRQAFDLLSDESSRKEFLFQLRWMVFSVDSLQNANPIKETYFPGDLFKFSNNECFVDCGAFDGDTLQAFILRNNDQFSSIVAFEPDPENYNKLTNYVISLPVELGQKIKLQKSALGSSQGIARFDAMGSVSSSITSTGSIEVVLQRLDDCLKDMIPTYIKMDIEGAEIDALKGGAQVIKEHHPKLAVCVYHTQDHIWEIPLEMNNLNPHHRLYLRRYDDEFGDVVCYSVPN
jgi:FkbM family methyltransferase